jgi:hypothetical protein
MLRRRLSSNCPFVSGGRCGAQQLLVALLADELAVFLQPGDREDLLGELVVADAQLVVVRLDDGNLLVDHLRQDLLVDAELPDQLFVDLPAELLLIRLDLRLVARLEIARGQVMPIHLGDHLARRGAKRGGGVPPEKVRDVENDERQHHQGEAPFEPSLVPTHAVEHVMGE